jgi:uncharacterized membrane protein
MHLVAIGYPETFLASLALEQLESLRGGFAMRRDEMAAIVRDDDGSFSTGTDPEIASECPAWTTLWVALFGSFFFVPLPPMPVGHGAPAILRRFDRTGFDPEFTRRVREMVKPGTSALFLLASTVGPDDVVAALEVYGGTVLQSEISPETERLVRETLDLDDADPQELSAVALDGRS